MLCRLKSSTCSSSKQSLTASSWGRSSSRREKPGRAWRASLKTCKSSWRCRPTAAPPETPATQTQINTDRAHNSPTDPKVAHSELEKRTQNKRSMINGLCCTSCYWKETRQCQFCKRKKISVIYNMIWYYMILLWQYMNIMKWTGK